MKFTQIAALCALASTAAFTQAAVWQDFSLSALYGENYKAPFEAGNEKIDQSTITAEYAAGLKYGDIFAFADRTNNDFGNETYFEVAPRLSLGAVTGQKLEAGPIKDVLISTTWEGGEGFNNYLYGIGFALDVPYTSYANINFYKVDSEKGSEDDYQMTIAYAVPFKIGSEEFLADAVLDWSTAEKNDHASELNWTSQYKWNAGKHISPETKLYFGIEHSVWNNKYSIKGLDEHNVSALVKYHF